MNTQNTQNNPTISYETILDSFKTGQGNTADLTSKYYFTDDKTISYLNGTYTLQLQDNEHLKALFIMLLEKEFKNKNVESLEKWIKHINSGYYLSLNHVDDSKVSVDRYARHRELFTALNITEVRSNGKGSKLVQLLCSPTNATIASLTSAGFANISPLLDGLSIIGLKAELPKIEG